MSISGVSPALGGQHLLRTGSLAAVTSGYQEASLPGMVSRCPWRHDRRVQKELSAQSSEMKHLAALAVLSWCPQMKFGISQAALGCSVSERRLQRSVSPGANGASDLASVSPWRLQLSPPTAAGSQLAERTQGGAADAVAQAAPTPSEQLPAEVAGCAAQLDRMGSSDQVDDNVRGQLPAAPHGAGQIDRGAGGKLLEVRMVPATAEVRPADAVTLSLERLSCDSACHTILMHSSCNLKRIDLYGLHSSQPCCAACRH